MATSILNRIARLFKASAHDALDKAEDPGAIARQMVRDLSADIAKLEELVASVIGDQKILAKQRDEAQDQAADWNDKARQAVAAGRYDLAAAALSRADRAEKDLSVFDLALVKLAPQVDDLKCKLDDLRQKKDSAEGESAVLDARAKAAHATSRAARILSGVGKNPVNFDSVRQRVDQIEANAEAIEEMAQHKRAQDLDAELATLSAVPLSVRLEALKTEVAAGAGGELK